jgi:acyl-CoA thioesterase
VLHRLVTTHFKRTHPKAHNADPWPISMQLVYLRRSDVGPAELSIKDVKLGRRTSTVHVALSQGGRDKVTGYVTVSDVASDTGITLPSKWRLSPAPVSSRPPQVDENGETTDGIWRKMPLRHADYRRAARQTRIYVPLDKQQEYSIVDQWARLWPVGPKGGPSKWTTESAAHLLDIFPIALLNMESAGAALVNPGAAPPPMWFPTVTLNIDFKKRIPPEGLEWLYSRVTMKSISNGRTDIEVVQMDEHGQLMAVMSQIGMIMSASRSGADQKSTL